MTVSTDPSAKEMLTAMAESSSIHGVSRWVTSKHWYQRGLWLLVFLGATCGASYQLWRLFESYTSYPVKTSVELDFSQLQFPAVSFCNMNPIKASQLSKTSNKTQESLQVTSKKKRSTDSVSYPSSDVWKFPYLLKKLKMSSTKYETKVWKSKNKTHGKRKKRNSVISTTSMYDASSTGTYSGQITGSSGSSSNSGQTTGFSGSSTNSGQTTGTSGTGTYSGQTTGSSGSGTYSGQTTGSSGSSTNSGQTTGSSGSGTYSGQTTGSSGSAINSGQTTGSSGSATNSGQTTGSSGTGTNSGQTTGSSGSGTYSGQTTTPGYGGFGHSYGHTTTDWSFSGDYDWVHEDGGSGAYSQFLSEMESQNKRVKDVWNTRVDTFKTEFQNNDIFTREQVGHDISDMLISCAFNGIKCYKENFTLFQSLEYGNCYTFQDTSYVTKQSGPLLGLRLVLNIETKEYIQNYMDATGLRLVIHEPGTLPFPEEEGFTLNPNYETTIGMRMLSIHRASEPHGSCESGEEFFDLFGIKYTIPACLKLCQIREIITRCHCKPSTSSLDLGIDDINVFDSCMDKDATLHCEDYVIYKIENQHISCNCRSPCNQIVYKTSLSGRTWPNHEYLVGNILPEICGVDSQQWYFESLCNVTTELMPDNLTGIQENFLKALIYYEDLNYEKISEEPLYDGFQLISDIGGALGLFMGASILSFVEVLQFMIELLNFLRHKIASRISKKTKVVNLKDNNLYNVGTKA